MYYLILVTKDCIYYNKAEDSGSCPWRYIHDFRSKTIEEALYSQSEARVATIHPRISPMQLAVMKGKSSLVRQIESAFGSLCIITRETL
jgi:hypothetical protein